MPTIKTALNLFRDHQFGDVAAQDNVVRTNVFAPNNTGQREIPGLVVDSNLVMPFQYQCAVGADVDDLRCDAERQRVAELQIALGAVDAVQLARDRRVAPRLRRREDALAVEAHARGIGAHGKSAELRSPWTELVDQL